MKIWIMYLLSRWYYVLIATFLSVLFSIFVHGNAFFFVFFAPFFIGYVGMIESYFKLVRVSEYRSVFRSLVLLIKGNVNIQPTLAKTMYSTMEQCKDIRLKDQLSDLHRRLLFGHSIEGYDNPFTIIEEGEVLWELLVAADHGVDICLGLSTLYQQVGANILYFEELLTKAKGKYFEISIMYLLSYMMFMLSRKSLLQPGYEWVVLVGSVVIHFGVWLSALFIHQMLKRNAGISQ